MKFGVVYPQTEFGTDAQAVKDYAPAAESAGLDFVEAYDHVLGANPERPAGWRGPYTYRSTFLEPFVLYGYWASLTAKLEFATNIIILPQRQTVLVAKQAATLDVLTGGRVRLGVGLGWNEVEYAALNENFHNRGRRMEEQVQVMRDLWTNELVSFSGRWHTIPDAGINPLPVQRPIPVWFGGRAPGAIQRMAQLADGWMTNFRNAEEARPFFDQLYKALDAAGRERGKFPIEARIPYGEGDPASWRSEIRSWRELGVTYFSLLTMGVGFKSPSQHIEAAKRFAETAARENL